MRRTWVRSALCLAVLALLAPASAPAASIDLRDGFQTRVPGLSSAGTSGHAQAAAMAESAGDVNGDGIPDTLVGDGGQFQDFDGAVFVIYGRRSTVRQTINPQNGIKPGQGYRIDGPSGAHAYGSSVANAGDVNGDGVPDALIGNGDLTDGVFLVYGQRSATPQTIDLDTLTPAQGVFIFGGPGVSGGCSIGDVNGDGIPDAALSGINGASDQPGSIFILFGQRPTGSLEIDLSSLTPQQGYLIRGSGIEQLNCEGGSANAGDVNGDQVPDQILGAPAAAPNGAGSGTAYVIFGQRTATPQTISTGALTPAQGYRINGAAPSAGLEAADGTGDVNGDGVPDQVVGAPGTFTSDPSKMIAGAAFVVYGQRSASPKAINLRTLGASQGYRISDTGVNATAGFSVDGAGDVDRDGVPDQIVGALGQGSTASVSGPGAAFVVYGQRTKTPARIDLAHLATAQGYAITGATAGDEAGTWVANAGDVDGDLQPDQLVVAPAANPISAASARARSAGSRFTTGYAYTVLAPNPPPPPRPVATAIPGRAAVDGARRARVVVTCLTSAPCRGRLALYRGGRAVSSAVRFSIAGGRRSVVRPVLATATHALLRRRGRLAVRGRAVTERPGPDALRDRGLALVVGGFTG